MLSSPTFKEILGNLQKIIEKIQLDVQFENIDKIISKTKSNELYRAANLLQLVSMIKMRSGAREEISEHINYILKIISEKRTSDKERIHFKEIWIEMFKYTVQVKDSKPLIKQFLKKLFKLQENYFEALIQDFLSVLAKSDSLFTVLSILLNTKADHPYVQTAYRFAIGIANILQTGEKNKTDLEMATIKFLNEETALSFFEDLTNYLIRHKVRTDDNIELKNVLAIKLLSYF